MTTQGQAARPVCRRACWGFRARATCSPICSEMTSADSKAFCAIPCRCRSRRKWKHCHLDRDKQQPRNINDLLNAIGQQQARGTVSVLLTPQPESR